MCKCFSFFEDSFNILDKLFFWAFCLEEIDSVLFAVFSKMLNLLVQHKHTFLLVFWFDECNKLWSGEIFAIL